MTTKINICFDTEALTSCRAADGIRDTALLLKDEGIRANYNMVGLLSQQLVNWRRFDVLDALKNHEISFHSKGHSIHPTLAEYTDLESYDEAHFLATREETEGMGMVRAATGATKLTTGCPPGSNISYVVQYVYAENGIDVYNGGALWMPDGSPVWMCGLSQMQYNICLDGRLTSDDYDPQEIIDYCSKRKRVILYNHPDHIRFEEHWDIVNYYRGNHHAWGEWDESPQRTEYVILRFYERFRQLVRLMKDAKNEDGSPKFEFVTAGDLIEEDRRDRRVKRENMPIYLSALRKAIAENTFSPIVFSNLGVEAISLSECLYAATKMLLDKVDEVDINGLILKGFLDAPKGVTTDIKLTFDEAMRAAKSINFEKFLPTSFKCGIYAIGPLDLLMALLEALADPMATEFAVAPKPQQPCLDMFPVLRDQNLKGAWIFWDKLEDNYLSERQRLQAWTIHN